MYQCFYEFDKKQLIIFSTEKIRATIKVNDNVYHIPELKKEIIDCEFPNANTIYINDEKVIVPFVHKKVPINEQTTEEIKPNNLDGLDLIKVTNNPFITTFGLTGQNYKIGIVDEEAVFKHYEFSNNDRVKFQETTTVNNHATHVAGTCAAFGYDAQAKGVAPEANIYSYTFNDWENNLIQCGSNGYNSCNNSWGYIIGWYYNYYFGLTYEYYIANYQSGPIRSPDFGKYAVYSYDTDVIAQTYENLLMCFAAGNDRNDDYPGGTWYIYSTTSGSWTAMDPNTYPPPEPDGDYNSIGMLGSAKNVLTVGATIDTDITPTGFSNWGPTNDLRIKPEVMANGASVYSTLSTGYTAYGNLSGTSMATPFVTGCGCLVQQFIEEQLGYFPESSLVKACLIHGAVAPTINAKNGYGLLDMENTLKYLDYVHQDLYLLKRETITNSDTLDSFTFTNLGTGSFVATLCYNDVEGPIQADYSTSQVIVNRLGLYIENNGTYYYPYRLESETADAVMKTSSSYDASLVYDWDNSQKIIIPSGLTGTVNVYVRRMNSLTGSQKYSLLISNNFENSGDNNMGDINVDNISMTGNISKNGSDLEVNLNNNNVLKIANPNGEVRIGSLNTGFTHFMTDRNQYYFNKSIYVNGNIYGYNNQITIDTPDNKITQIKNDIGYVNIGPQNTGFCHFITNMPRFYFNKLVYVNGSINSYRRDLQLNPAGSSTNGTVIKQSNGFVGIKTQSPTQALEVNGSVKANGYFNFAGLHECYFENDLEVGQLVVATGLTKNNLAVVEPSTQLEQKNIYGVVDDIQDDKAFVKCVGQGKVTVIGPIQKGDLITTSNEKGLGIKQDSDVISNFTLAKALEDSDETREILVHFLC